MKSVTPPLNAPVKPPTETSRTELVPFLAPDLAAELPAFEAFFKAFGFKQIHGRIWGLLVLAGKPMSSKEIAAELAISSGATSTTLKELIDWGAVHSTFDPPRRCNLHAAVENTLSIVATVLRRREQVAFQNFREGANRALDVIRKRHGNKDPRVLTLRSVLSTCDIADAVMQLVFSSVHGALGDPQSLLSKAIGTALKVGGVALPGARRQPVFEDLSGEDLANEEFLEGAILKPKGAEPEQSGGGNRDD